MSSIQKFFPRGEFTPVGCDDALDGAVLALKALATGRSTGLTKAECEVLYSQIWQITNCALAQKEDQESLVTVKQEVTKKAKENPDVTNIEKRLIIYSDALKSKVERMFGVTWSKLKAKGKKADVVRIRAIIINASIRSGVGGLTQFGVSLGRNHATILHAKNVLHEKFMLTDKEYVRDFEALCRWWAAIKINAVSDHTDL